MALLLNLLSIVFTNSLVERLTLVSLELAVLSLAVWTVIKLLRIRSERVCALLWLLVLAKALFGFVMGAQFPLLDLRLDPDLLTTEAPMLTAERPRSADGAIPPTLPSPPAAQQALGRGQTPPAKDAVRSAELEPESLAQLLMQTRRYVIVTSAMVAGVLAGLWLIGVAALLLLTGRDIVLIRRLYQNSTAPSRALGRAYAEEAARLAIASPPRLLVSDRIVTPALVGWFRPVVLLPLWVAEEMAPDQVRWLLGHELMHWKHLDTLGLLVRRAAQVLFWFHPAVWYAGKRWEESMERACDRALVADMDQARDYAQQLYLILHKLTRRKALLSFSTGLFVTRTQVGRRIELLLTNPMAMPARLGAVSIGALLLLAALTLPSGIALVDSADDNASGSLANSVSPDAAQPGDGVFGTPAPQLITLSPEQCNDWLKIDLGDPMQQPIPGWVSWSAVYDHGINEHAEQAFSVPFDPYLEIELSRDVMWRRFTRADLDTPHNQLLRDGIRSFGEIRLTFRELDEGDYVLAPVSCNPEQIDPTRVTYDVTLNGNPIQQDVPTAYRDTLDMAFTPPIRFTIADRPDLRNTEVVIGFRPKHGPLWINGFMLRKAGKPFGAAVSRISVANGKQYALTPAAIGEKAYIDRDYTIVSLPPELDHQILLQTANDDKNIESSEHLTLEVMRPATVYLCSVALPERLPEWAQAFQPTGKKLVTTDRIYQVYGRPYPAGPIVLGGNKSAEYTAPSQYLVVIVPDRSAED